MFIACSGLPLLVDRIGERLLGDVIQGLSGMLSGTRALRSWMKAHDASRLKEEGGGGQVESA